MHGKIKVDDLPWAPYNFKLFQLIVEHAFYEAGKLQNADLNTILIDNMNHVLYLKK